jgi:hypothetical protein
LSKWGFLKKIADPINEKALCKLITKDLKIMLQIFPDYFILTNGYMAAKCNYSHHEVIGKLFKLGHLSDYKDFKPVNTRDFSDVFNNNEAVTAKDTKLFMVMEGKGTVKLFQSGESLHAYNTEYLNVFTEGFEAKLEQSSRGYPIMQIWNQGEQIGVVMPVRCPEAENIKIKHP